MAFPKNDSNKTGGDAGGILSSTNGTIVKTGVFNPYLLKLKKCCCNLRVQNVIFNFQRPNDIDFNLYISQSFKTYIPYNAFCSLY